MRAKTLEPLAGMLEETNPDCSRMLQTAGRLEEMVVAELGRELPMEESNLYFPD